MTKITHQPDTVQNWLLESERHEVIETPIGKASVGITVNGSPPFSGVNYYTVDIWLHDALVIRNKPYRFVKLDGRTMGSLGAWDHDIEHIYVADGDVPPTARRAISEAVMPAVTEWWKQRPAAERHKEARNHARQLAIDYEEREAERHFARAFDYRAEMEV